MTTIKIEFPADRPDIALAFGKALNQIAGTVSVSTGHIAPEVAASDQTGQPEHTPMTAAVITSGQGINVHADVPKTGPDITTVESDEDDDNTPADPNAPEHDAEGLIWDKRIHASSKARNADDTWRLRRKPKEFNTDDDWQNYVDAVKVELRDGPAPASQPEAPAPVAPQPEAPAPVAPPVAPPAPQPEAPTAVTFGDLMRLARDHEAMPRLNQMVGEMFPGTVVAQLAAPVGKDKLQPVYDALKAELNA